MGMPHFVAGNTSSYAEQNLSERDYLRTEGDPGAAGYTIKEAVALARSLVSIFNFEFFGYSLSCFFVSAFRAGLIVFF